MIRPRVVYDTMLFVQWALLPAGRQHGTAKLFEDGRVQVCVSEAMVAELGRALRYPELRQRAPHLDDALVIALVRVVSQKSTWIDPVPVRFGHSLHAKDDHVFNLALAAEADFIVTWETRHLEMDRAHPDDFGRLQALRPSLRIVDPPALLRELSARRE